MHTITEGSSAARHKINKIPCSTPPFSHIHELQYVQIYKCLGLALISIVSRSAFHVAAPTLKEGDLLDTF